MKKAVKRVLSEESRRKMAEAQQARWAKHRAVNPGNIGDKDPAGETGAVESSARKPAKAKKTAKRKRIAENVVRSESPNVNVARERIKAVRDCVFALAMTLPMADRLVVVIGLVSANHGMSATVAAEYLPQV